MRQDGQIILGYLSRPAAGAGGKALAGDGSWGLWGGNDYQPVPLSPILTDLGAPGNPAAYLAGDGSWRLMDGTLVAGSGSQPSAWLTALGAPDDSTKFLLDDMTWGAAPALPTVQTPTFAPVAGEYAEAQSVTIACADPRATIRYTVDGSAPNGASPLYAGPIAVAVTTTVKARAFRAPFTQSAVGTAVYTITPP